MISATAATLCQGTGSKFNQKEFWVITISRRAAEGFLLNDKNYVDEIRDEPPLL